MSHQTRRGAVYLRFLQLAQAIQGLPSLSALDPLEERILTIVATASHGHQRLCVRDMMAKPELGSPTTIHGRLKSMREKGWITLADTEDSRRKQISLTAEAMLHFEKLSRCLLKAVGPI